MNHEEQILSTLQQILKVQQQALENQLQGLAMQQEAVENQKRAIAHQQTAVAIQSRFGRLYRIVLAVGAVLVAILLFKLYSLMP